MTAENFLIFALLIIAALGVMLLWALYQRDEAREELRQHLFARNAQRAHNDPATASHWQVQHHDGVQDAKSGNRRPNWFDIATSDGSGGVPRP